VTLRRLAYVVDGFPKPSQTFVAEEIAEVLRRGIEVLVLSSREGTVEPLHEVVRSAGLLARTRYDVPAFGDELARFRPDLVHAHFARAATAHARALADDMGVPYTFTAHGYDVWRRPPDDLADRSRAAAAVITVSRANAVRLEALGAPPERLHVVPCGVDIDRFRPGRPGSGAPRIVVVARLHPVKNLDLFLHACARLRDAGTPFAATIVGDGDERDGLVALRDSLDLGGHVAFAGAATQAQVAEWWRAADIGALCSSSEGMPVSLMEAAACGVPVVATDVGGVSELVAHGRTGLVVPPGDVAAFAAALDALIADVPRREEMGRRARERAVADFSVGRQVDALVDVWNDALGRAA
jgi:glycosyltransferase involved in cell wall biosynthesis